MLAPSPAVRVVKAPASSDDAARIHVSNQMNDVETLLAEARPLFTGLSGPCTDPAWSVRRAELMRKLIEMLPVKRAISIVLVLCREQIEQIPATGPAQWMLNIITRIEEANRTGQTIDEPNQDEWEQLNVFKPGRLRDAVREIWRVASESGSSKQRIRDLGDAVFAIVDQDIASSWEKVAPGEPLRERELTEAIFGAPPPHDAAAIKELGRLVTARHGSPAWWETLNRAWAKVFDLIAQALEATASKNRVR